MEKDREDCQKMDGTLFVIRGTVGYICLIALGLFTNIFSKELAAQLVIYLVPMFLFIIGSSAFDVLDDLIARARSKQENAPVHV